MQLRSKVKMLKLSDNSSCSYNIKVQLTQMHFALPKNAFFTVERRTSVFCWCIKIFITQKFGSTCYVVRGSKFINK
jgi:hypothetical protein